MASYGIFRVEKLKKITNLINSLKHAFREQSTPNADPDRTPSNVLLTPNAYNVESTMRIYEDKLPKEGKIRNDVVRAIEVLVTASPEKLKEMTEHERMNYFKEALAFCNKEMGGEGNLLHAQIHNDETSAHLTAFYIPLHEKKNKRGKITRRMNADAILGNQRKYSNRQTEFYEQVSKKYGLERGEIGSKAEHKRIADWYREINAEKLGKDLPSVLAGLTKNAIKTMSFDVEVPVRNIFGIYTDTEKQKETVKLKSPVIPIASLEMALKPYLNSNSEMKRREKEEERLRARRELEEEVKAKFKNREIELAKREEQLKVTLRNVGAFYGTLADKLGVKLETKIGKEIRQMLVDKAEKNGKLARLTADLLAFKDKVGEEISKWKNVRNEQVFANFDDYSKHFEILLDDNNKLKRQNADLKDDKGLLDRIKGKISNLFKGTYEEIVDKLVEIANKIADPKFIKEKYDEHCLKMVTDNQEKILKNLDVAMNRNLLLNYRSQAFSKASDEIARILEYTNDRISDEITEKFNQAKNVLEEDRKLQNSYTANNSMRMRR